MIIKRVQGDTYNLDVQILKIDGTPFPLTGCTVYFTVKRNIEDTDNEALIQKNVTSHTNPITGETSFSFTANEVDIDGEFYYDVKVKDGSGIISSVIKDKILFLSHVTLRTT